MPRRRLPRVTVVLIAAGALLFGLAPAAQAVTKAKAPTHVHIVVDGYGQFEVGWKAAKGATRYRVVVAKDKAMKHVVYRSAYTSAKARWVHGAKIKEGVRYYVRVQAYRRTKAGGKSKVIAVTPKVRPVGKPATITEHATSPTSIQVAWSRASYATGYTVKLMATPTGAARWSRTVSASTTSLAVTGINLSALGLPRAFFVKVTAVRLNKTFRDSNTLAAAVPFPTSPAALATTPSTVSVGSYNVMQVTKSAPLYPAWSDRVTALGAVIASMHVDILGVQEATWGAVDDGARPADELAAASGMALAMDPSSTSTHFVPCSSHSVPIYYNPAKYAVTECGDDAMTDSTTNCCYTWALLRNVQTGLSVFVVNTHLATGSTATDLATRTAETRTIISFIRDADPGSYPVVLTGDLNSYELQASTTPMSVFARSAVFAGQGLIGTDLTALSTTNLKYASGHNFAPTKANYVHIDHILASSGVVARSFTVDAHPGQESVAPSDHWPVQAVLNVYGG